MAEVLKPETNIPYELAMKFDSPKIVKSELTGDKQAMITLVDGRIVYVPQFVAEKIADAGIRRNDPFILCRREIRDGNRKSLVWQVKPAEAAKPELVTPTSPARAEAPRTASNSHESQQQHGQPTTSEPLAPAAARFMSGYQIAIDILLEARAYAQRKGLPLEVRCEDVRALAATIMIDQQRQLERLTR